jgi:hypothetical protein
MNTCDGCGQPTDSAPIEVDELTGGFCLTFCPDCEGEHVWGGEA